MIKLYPLRQIPLSKGIPRVFLVTVPDPKSGLVVFTRLDIYRKCTKFAMRGGYSVYAPSLSIVKVIYGRKPFNKIRWYCTGDDNEEGLINTLDTLESSQIQLENAKKKTKI